MLDYIKFSFRLLGKTKLYTFISVFGLAVGISCCILIGMFVKSELSYDNFHPDKEKLYRITTIGGGFTVGLSSFGIGPTLYKDYPEVIDYCRYLSIGGIVDVKYKDKQFNERNIILADSSFFDIFGFKLLKGDLKGILTVPRTVILSEKMAQKYFGNQDPINEIININKNEYQIIGVIENQPDNTDIRYQAIASIGSLSKQRSDVFYEDWYRIVCFTYIKFNQIPDMVDFQAKLDEFSDKYVKPWGEANDTKQIDYYRAGPIEKVHFDNKHEFDSPKGNISYIYIFSSVALFVLLIACINYINLSLSKSTSRAKEIGVRKTLGSNEQDIKTQFLTETFIITLIAFFIGLIFIEILLPLFNSLTLKTFEFSDLISFSSFFYSITFIILITLLAGVYPAFVLSSFNPIEVLKGQKGKRTSIGITRKILLTIQFAFSISMIISSIIVFQQMTFMKNKDLGFDQDQTLVFRIPGDTVFTKKLDHIQQLFAKSPIVKKTAFSSTVPGAGFGELMFRVERDSVMKDAQLRLMSCDENYFELSDIKIIKGRNFNDEMSTEGAKSFIINKSVVEKFGWGDNALGKRMQWGLLPNGKAEHDGVVVGIIEDFHTQSMHNEIAPLAIQYVGRKSFFSVKLQGENYMRELAKLKSIWQEELGDRIMENFFLDDNFNQQYHAEERMLRVFNYFTIISIILSTLGLFALTSFMIKQKTREIGIRKILGASLNNIIFIISRDFIILMFIGLILASVPTYYFIDRWLKEFSYHINAGILPILIAAFITFVVIMVVTIYNTIKTTNFKPIDALKSE